MTPNRKAASPVQDLGTLGETASKPHANLTINPVISQAWHTCGNSAEAQRQRLLAAIKERGSISTLEARKPDLDIMHPSARVMELRKKGEPIQTVRVPEVSPAGKVHNVARYYIGKDAEVLRHD